MCSSDLGTMLVVGAVDANNRMASFSNRAGDTAQYYLVAQGVNILSSYGTGYAYMSGTSMAAPAVSGAAALVTGYWPYLQANQVAAILLNTADDLGAPGVDAVYGHGLLNVSRALSPIGSYTYRASNGYTVTVPLSVSGVSARQPSAASPAAFAGLRTEVFDAYGRNFTSDEGSSLAVRTVLTSAMVMGRGLGSDVQQRNLLDGSQLTLWQVARSPNVQHIDHPTVMSPLGGGVMPDQGVGNPAPSGLALRWTGADGRGLSLGSGGLGSLGLGLMGAAHSPALRDDLAAGGLHNVTSSPLLGLSPNHRFAVINLPLARSPLLAGGEGQWQARVASLRADVPGPVRSARGDVSLGELSWGRDDVAMNLSLARLSETGLLGGYSHSALGLDAQHSTDGLSWSGAWRVADRWSATAAWSQTLTHSPDASGLLLGGTAIRADARGVGLTGRALWRDDDRLSVA